jgi:hypothetical protein
MSGFFAAPPDDSPSMHPRRMAQGLEDCMELSEFALGLARAGKAAGL